MATAPAQVGFNAIIGPSDGVNDFGGSGCNYSGPITATTSITAFPALGPTSLAEFVGTGTVQTFGIGQAYATGSGPTNVLSITQSDVAAIVGLQYEYDPPAATGVLGTRDSNLAGGVFDMILEPLLRAGTMSMIAGSLHVDDTPLDWSRDFTVPRFDPALGTLEDVVFELTNRPSYGFEVENLGSSSATVTGSASTSYTISAGGRSPTSNSSSNVTSP